MKHSERIHAVREGVDYKAPLQAINETIEGLVHSALIVRSNEDGTLLTPEARALDAIGSQVHRELRQRAEMIVALTHRCNVLEARLRGEPEPVEKPTLREQLIEAAMMPEQQRKTLTIAE
jgi:hypothetical protein